MKIMSVIKARIFGNKNNAILFKNISGAFLIKGGALIVSFLSTPAFIRYFNDQAVLGVWYTLLSVITWLLNFDLGIGNGLRNKLAESIALGDKRKSRELVSSAYITFLGLVLLISIVGYVASVFVDWNSFFNLSTELVDKATMLRVMRNVFIGIMLQFFLKLISSVLYAIQKSAVNNAITLLIHVLQLLFVIAVPDIFNTTEKLLLLSYAYIVIINLPYLLATIILFTTKLKDIRPRVRNYDFSLAKAVLNTGGIIFVCQLLYMVIVNTNDFFISGYTKPENVVDYQIYSKIFSLVGTFVTLALTPVWSMVTKASAECDYTWLRKTYNYVLYSVGFVAIGQVLILFFLKPILHIWLGENTIEIDVLKAGVFVAWSIIFTIHNALSTFACGLGKMKTQVICYGAGVVFKIVFLYAVYQNTDNWVWVVISNIILMLPYCIAQHIILRREFNKTETSVIN